MKQTSDLEFNIDIIGATGVGKSSLARQFGSHPTAENSSRGNASTITRSFLTRNTTNELLISFNLFERQINKTYVVEKPNSKYANSGVMAVFDMTNRGSFDIITSVVKLSQVNELGRIRPKCIMVLVGTKSDLKQLRKVETAEAKRFADSMGIAFVEIDSMQLGDIDKAFFELGVALLKSIDRPRFAAMRGPCSLDADRVLEYALNIMQYLEHRCYFKQLDCYLEAPRFVDPSEIFNKMATILDRETASYLFEVIIKFEYTRSQPFSCHIKSIILPLLIDASEKVITTLTSQLPNNDNLAELVNAQVTTLSQVITFAKEDLSQLSPCLLSLSLPTREAQSNFNARHAAERAGLKIIFQHMMYTNNIPSVCIAGQVCKEWYSISRTNSLWFPLFQNLHSTTVNLNPPSKIELPFGYYYRICMQDFYVVCGFVATKTGVVSSSQGTTRIATDRELISAISVAPNQVFAFCSGEYSHSQNSAEESLQRWENAQNRRPINVRISSPIFRLYRANQFPSFCEENTAISLARSFAWDTDDDDGTCPIPVVARAKFFASNNIHLLKLLAVRQVNELTLGEYKNISDIDLRAKKSSSSKCSVQ